ncbi:MAG: hypothetical protein Kow0080_00740 [Candidatus Promineifilaceae bacterium]
MQIFRMKTVSLVLIVSLLFVVGCMSDVEPTPMPEVVGTAAAEETAVSVEPATEPTAEPVKETVESTPPEPTPALRPIAPATSISDPASQLEEYMAEGLFISHFDSDDIGMWQGYSQETETSITSGDPPEGYINSANWHAKQTDRWVLPTDGFVLESDERLMGDGAGRWSDTTVSTRIVTTGMPNDWSDYMFLSFWAYSEKANDAGIEIAIYSELDSTSADDYYKKEIIVDWEGWKLFEIPLHEFAATRDPVGWHKIDYIKIASSGWGHEPKESTNLIFDEMKLSNVRIGPKLAVDIPTDLEHPFLMLNKTEIAEIKDKVEKYEWAQLAFATLQAHADNWLNKRIEVPETGGGFYHADDALAYAITEAHYDLADAAQDLALMYQFTGNLAYMEKAKEILLAYADSYLTYEIHDKEGRTGEQASAGGRVTAQGINEARWVIPLAWAYDLIYNEMTDAERTAVADQILRPAADLLMLNNEGRHNHQTWYNSGVGIIGFVLGEREYVWYALLKDDSSLVYQLDKSITDDGMWYEGSMHYQLYVLRALQPLLEATYHAGFDVYGHPHIKGLFDFMVAYADPNLELPTINDGRVVNLAESDRAPYYELAYTRFGDPTYVPILEQSYRNSLNALLYGRAQLGEAETPAWKTQYFEDSNLVVLRSGEEIDRLQTVVNFMGYQGGHSHADQLSLVIYGMGMPLFPDAGSIKYREPEQEGWFKQTLAHNTLVVDGVSQERASAAEVKQFVNASGGQILTVAHSGLYPGVVLTRTVLMNDDYLIDIFNAASAGIHQYDLVYHNIGTFSTEDIDFQPASEKPGDGGGYEYLQNVETGVFDGDWSGNWHIGPSRDVRINMFGEPDTTYFSALGPVAERTGDVMAEYPIPVLIARREVTSTQFVSIIQPYKDEAEMLQITAVSITDENGNSLPQETTHAFRLERENATDLFILGDKLGIKNTDEIKFNATWVWLSQADGELQWLLMSGALAAGDGWTISQEDLDINKTPEGMGLYVEVAEPGRLIVSNIHQYVTYITLEGFMDSAARVVEYTYDGREIREMPTRTNENGVVEFLAHPGVMYEVIGE